MPLTECRECGKQISTEAANCPHCGVPNPARIVPAVQVDGRSRRRRRRRLLLAVGVAAVALMMMCFRSDAGGNATDTRAVQQASDWSTG